MDRDRLIRRALTATAVMNVAAMPLFAFPATFASITGFPPVVPRMYALLAGVFVALFGAVYGVLARQPDVDRAMVAIGALGKSAAVVIVVVCWLLGELPVQTVVLISADLGFAALFAWWLLTTVAVPAASVRSAR
jgi:hypothetical protein